MKAEHDHERAIRRQMAAAFKQAIGRLSTTVEEISAIVASGRQSDCDDHLADDDDENDGNDHNSHRSTTSAVDLHQNAGLGLQQQTPSSRQERRAGEEASGIPGSEGYGGSGDSGVLLDSAIASVATTRESLAHSKAEDGSISSRNASSERVVHNEKGKAKHRFTGKLGQTDDAAVGALLVRLSEIGAQTRRLVARLATATKNMKRSRCGLKPSISFRFSGGSTLTIRLTLARQHRSHSQPRVRGHRTERSLTSPLGDKKKTLILLPSLVYLLLQA